MPAATVTVRVELAVEPLPLEESVTAAGLKTADKWFDEGIVLRETSPEKPKMLLRVRVVVADELGLTLRKPGLALKVKSGGWVEVVTLTATPTWWVSAPLVPVRTRE